jgi:Fe-S cluster assembly ATPase SufC
MLEIRNLHATVGGKPILKGLDLEIGAGQVHAIMGPNGAGKSTLGNVIAGRSLPVRSFTRVKTCSIWNRKKELVKVYSWRFSTRWRFPASITPIFCAQR